ncbi:DUF4386 domain-containing protein [soil metagenome]
MKNFNSLSQRHSALITGYSLLLMAAVAGYAYGYAFQNLYISGDSAATYNRLNESPDLLTRSILAFGIIIILDVVVAWSTYFFFRNINKPIALLSSWFRLIYTAIFVMAVSSLLYTSEMLQSSLKFEDLIYQNMNKFLDIWALGLIVISFHILLLGYLMLKSAQIPGILGVITVIAGICYLISNVCHFLLPNYEIYKATVDMALTLPMAAGELGLAFWLLIKGGKTKKSTSLQDPVHYPV